MWLGTIQDDCFNGEHWFSQKLFMSKNAIWTPKKVGSYSKTTFTKTIIFFTTFYGYFLSFLFLLMQYTLLFHILKQNVFFPRISINKNKISNE